MDNSILYGLRNPAMTDDIGMSMIERQYPTTITTSSYGFADGTAPKINNGQPQTDTYQTKRQKEYSTIKKVLLGLGAAALGLFAFKKGSKLIKKGYNYIKTNASPAFDKCKNFISNIFSKIKNKISP